MFDKKVPTDYKISALVYKLIWCIILIAIFSLAFYLFSFVWNFGMPNYPNVDETINISYIWKLYNDKSYLLDYFKYPGLNFYYGVIILKILDKIPFIDISNLFNTAYILRLIYNGSSLFSFIFVFFAIKNMSNNNNVIVKGGGYIFRHNNLKALIGTLLALFSLYYPQVVYYSGPDVLLICIGNILLYLGVKIFKSNNYEKSIYFLYPIFCIGIGIAFSIKYHGILFLILLIYLHFIKGYYKNYKYNFILLFNILLIILVFVGLNFTMFIDFRKFIEDILFNFNNYNGYNHALYSNSSFIGYTKSFLGSSYGILGIILSIMGILYFIKTKEFKLIGYLLILPIITIVILSKYNLMISRNISFTIVFNIILMTYGLDFLTMCFFKSDFKIPYFLTIICIVVNIIIIIYSCSFKESRKSAEVWIEDNIPENSTIYINPNGYIRYYPIIDSKKYNVIREMPTKLNKDEYLIESEFYYGRFFRKKESWIFNEDYLFPNEMNNYLELVNKFNCYKEFKSYDYSSNHGNKMGYLDIFKYNKNDYFSGPTIRIYKN